MRERSAGAPSRVASEPVTASRPVNPPGPCQPVCQIWLGQKSNACLQACDLHFCALGGIRTPNLLIRSGRQAVGRPVTALVSQCQLQHVTWNYGAMGMANA